MLLIETEHCRSWSGMYINAAMVQDIHVVDNNVNANIIDAEGYMARIARFDTKEQATAALERLIPYLGRSGDGIVKLAQWTGKEDNNVG